MRKSPVRIRHEGNGSWRISGDAGPNRTISVPWGGWNRMWNAVSLFRNLGHSKQPVVFEAGKKNKKFWRKVQQHIQRFAPRDT